MTFKNATKLRKYKPYVFTEHGVVMLSAVLKSSEAIKVSVMVVNEFIKLRKLQNSRESSFVEVEDLKKSTNHLFQIVFSRLEVLEAESPILPSKRKKIGVRSK